MPETRAETLHLACPRCLTRNRVHVARFPHQPRCGHCGIPTLILFREGHEVDRVAGALDARAIVQWASR